MIKNIIFDFDGVIADSFDVNLALSKEHDEDATLEDFLAHHDGNVFETPRINFKPERLEEFYAEYRKRLGPSHIERASAPLRRLGEKHSLYIISSNGEEGIKEVLEKAGVVQLFTRIMGAETHTSKEEKFKMLMADNAVTPENSVFITDTLGDIKEAHKVNIRTIAETFGFHDKERLAQGNPFKIVDSWEEIEDTINEL
jgi:phosphoglycolate phosphatase